MAFELPALPYDKTALEPHISAQTFEFHHGKHHNTYVVNLNKLVEGTDLADASLEDIIVKSRAMRRRPACSTTPPRCGTTPSSGIR